MEEGVIDYYLSLLEDKSINAETTLQEAIRDPHLFVFAELLNHPRVKTLNSVLVQKVHAMAYGTYKQYVVRFGFDERECEKMRRLTVITIFNLNGWCDVPISVFCEELDLPNPIAVMRFLIAMNRSKIIDVRIDEKLNSVTAVNVHVHRDVDPSTLEQHMMKFRELADRVTTIVDNPIAFVPEQFRNLNLSM